jgi:outer membrane protein
LQLDPFGTYEFVVPDIEEVEPVLEEYDVRSMLRNAFDERPDLQAQQISIEAASEGIRVARAGIYPTISLSGGIGTGYSSQSFVPTGIDAEGDPTGFERQAFFDQFTDNRSQSVTLSLNVPIFNRLQTKTNVERARVQYDNARLDLDNIQQDIALQVRQAYLDYERDKKRLDVTDVQFRAAQQALDAEQERYNVGASTLVELSQARASFVQASSDRAQAKYDFIFRKKLIEYYTGVLDPARPLFE